MAREAVRGGDQLRAVFADQFVERGARHAPRLQKS